MISLYSRGYREWTIGLELGMGRVGEGWGWNWGERKLGVGIRVKSKWMRAAHIFNSYSYAVF